MFSLPVQAIAIVIALLCIWFLFAAVKPHGKAAQRLLKAYYIAAIAFLVITGPLGLMLFIMSGDSPQTKGYQIFISGLVILLVMTAPLIASIISQKVFAGKHKRLGLFIGILPYLFIVTVGTIKNMENQKMLECIKDPACEASLPSGLQKAPLPSHNP